MDPTEVIVAEIAGCDSQQFVFFFTQKAEWFALLSGCELWCVLARFDTLTYRSARPFVWEMNSFKLKSQMSIGF